MMTLLQSALTGWTDYTQHGKFAALLLLAILYLGFVLYGSGKEANASGAEKARKRLYLYGTLVTFGCICPVTALIPDRLLLLCMDLGGGTPDSIDRMGNNGLSV